ncbi:MAG: tRNA dihydrouridine synthase DusB [Heliobacteriaceae bacterium]|nr:tRNA dihydrouridine synthase DusB [Heliobacteriaceae bacterium]MDD4587961.1 tRNA dihydrouridine synthase DusB [Heliobacteriaceae bacterium]
MLIGTYAITPPFFAAPMAGVTDKAFRLVLRDHGCPLVYTEMISDKALTYGNRNTLALLDVIGEVEPVAVQLFGSEPETMAKAARLAVAAGASIIDLNMGCPVPKVVKNNEGASLLKDLPRAVAIADRVVAAVPVPVTVKMRAGWAAGRIIAPELAGRLVAVGVQAITVHGRTRDQFYAGQADWRVIRETVAQAAPVPVIGNGDVWEPADAVRMLAETGCAGVMIGRGCLGNPWIFSRLKARVTSGCLPPPPTPAERIRQALAHLERAVTLKGEERGVKEMRGHLAWYLKGMPGAARLRVRINQTRTFRAVVDILENYLPN